jgi:hypothetical protein
MSDMQYKVMFDQHLRSTLVAIASHPERINNFAPLYW